MKPIKIAIVDDHKLFRQDLIQILRKFSSYEVVLEAESGLEFFEKLSTKLPEIVLLDLHMREMDGKEVSRRLIQEYPQLKIIILSMDYSHESILQLLRVGVHSYLPKNIDNATLDEAIKQVYTKGYYLHDAASSDHA